MVIYEYCGEEFDNYEDALQCAIENADIDEYYYGLRDYIDNYGFITLLRKLPEEVLEHIYEYVSNECRDYINEIGEPDESEEKE